MIGPPFEVSFPSLGVPLDDIERMVLAYRDRYEDVGLFENDVYPGIAEMLEELIAAGHTLSIATAKPEPTAAGSSNTSASPTTSPCRPGRPSMSARSRRTKAEVIDYTLFSLRLGPSDLPRVVMVGDRDHDVEGAHRTGSTASA